MSLYLWQPTEDEARQDGFRKHYVNGEKVQHGFPTFLQIFAEEKTPTPENFVLALEQTWAEDWNVCFSQFAPPRDQWATSWRRLKDTLVESKMDFVVLDFDGDHPEITPDSTLEERVSIAKSMLPMLENLELVSFFSSSGFYKNTAKPHRMNLHIVVWFDKPYPREQVRKFLQSYSRSSDGESLLDPAMSVKTQPHIVANPIFKNTERFEPKGPRVILTPGGRLSLDDLKIPFNETENGPRESRLNDLQLSSELTLKEQEILRDLVSRSDRGQLDGMRRNTFTKALWTANFFNNGDTRAFREAIKSDPKLLNNHDIDSLDRHLRGLIENELTGGEFGSEWHNVKRIKHLDLADFDLSSVPKEGAVICLKSGCGSGKTKGIIKRLMDITRYRRALYVSALKATIEPAARAIDFAYYLQHGEEAKADWCVSNDRVAITDKSLKVFFDSNNVFLPFDVVFIDESERVALNSVDPASRTQELFTLCRAAKLVVLLDADASCDLTGWFAEEIATSSEKELLALINDKDWMGEGHCVYALEAEKDVIGITEILLGQGERVYFHTSRSDRYKQLSALARHFQQRYPDKNILAYDAETAPKRLKKEPSVFIDELIDNEGLDLLIVSPWSKIGWDYNGNHHFGATVGHYPHTFITAPDICQQMRRPRQTKKHYVWLGRRPNDTTQRLADLDKTFPIRPGQLKADLPVSLNLAERAKRQRERQKRNIPYHLKLIIIERGGAYKPGCSTPRTDEGIRHLLTLIADEEQEKAIHDQWNCPFKKTELLSRFERVPNDWSSPFEVEQSNLSFEEFHAFYHRDLKKRNMDICAVSSIWFLEPSMREELDEKDQRFFAELTGRLLDEVDAIVRKFMRGSNHRFIHWLRDEDSRELRVLFTREDFRPVRELMDRCFIRYEHHIPWLEKQHNTSYVKFFQAMAEAFDLGFEYLEPQGNKKDAKHAVIHHFMKTEPGLIKPSKAKKIPNINEKTKVIEELLRVKLRKNEPLSAKEEAFLCHQGHLICFYKYKYPHTALVNQLDRAALESFRFFNFS